jgi:hypothetical protein
MTRTSIKRSRLTMLIPFLLFSFGSHFGINARLTRQPVAGIDPYQGRRLLSRLVC